MGICASAKSDMKSNMEKSGLSVEELSKKDYSVADMGAAIKDALKQAAEKAEETTSAPGSFDDPEIRISLPDEVDKLRTPLKAAGEEELVNELETEMNKAAEMGCEGCSKIFGDAISDLSVDDAQDLMQSDSDTAATDFLKSKCEAPIKEKMDKPIEEAMGKSKVNEIWEKIQKVYDEQREKASGGAIGGLMSKVGMESLPELKFDLKDYIASKGVGALFTRIAASEKDLRANPAGAVTDLAKGVFGKFSGEATEAEGNKSA